MLFPQFFKSDPSTQTPPLHKTCLQIGAAGAAGSICKEAWQGMKRTSDLDIENAFEGESKNYRQHKIYDDPVDLPSE